MYQRRIYLFSYFTLPLANLRSFSDMPHISGYGVPLLNAFDFSNATLLCNLFMYAFAARIFLLGGSDFATNIFLPMLVQSPTTLHLQRLANKHGHLKKSIFLKVVFKLQLSCLCTETCDDTARPIFGKKSTLYENEYSSFSASSQYPSVAENYCSFFLIILDKMPFN